MSLLQGLELIWSSLNSNPGSFYQKLSHDGEDLQGNVAMRQIYWLKIFLQAQGLGNKITT